MKVVVNWTLYAMFAALFLFDGFLGEGVAGVGLHLFPRKLSFSIEILAFAVAFYLLIIYALNKRFSIGISYFLLFFLFIVHLIVGIVFNTVPAGAIFGGIRRYFIFIPLFILPIVYRFTDREILTQLKVLLFFGLIQCPVTIIQRFFLYSHHVTGDYIIGTLKISSILSLYQIFCITVLTAFYMKNRIKLPLFLFLALILFIPTALNETKGTFVLFPIAIILTILFGTGRIINLKKITLITSTSMMIFFLFIPLYGYLYPDRDIVAFFQGTENESRSIQKYLYRGDSEDHLGERKVGRIDTILFPFKVLSNEPFKLIIGLGMGNVNRTGIRMFEGEYMKYDDNFNSRGLTATSLIWETGLIGFFLNITFLWFVMKDAAAIRSLDNIKGDIALGWIGVVMVLGLSFFYKNAFHERVISYLFWYISGLIVAARSNKPIDDQVNNS